MVYSRKGVSRRDFLKIAGSIAGGLALSGCLPALYRDSEGVVVRVERPVVEGARVVGTDRENLNLEELTKLLAGGKFRGYATYSGFAGATGDITIYSHLKNPDELDTHKFSNGYDLFHDPNRRVPEGRIALFDRVLRSEEIAQNLISKAILVPVYTDGEAKIAAIPLVNNLGIGDVASGFKGELPNLWYSFSVPLVGREGERREGIDDDNQEPPGTVDPKPPDSPFTRR